MSKEYALEIIKDIEVGDSHIYGVKIKDFTKPELEKLCVMLGKWQQEQNCKHAQQLDRLSELIAPKEVNQ